MIYLCTQDGSLYAHHYYYHNNHIYIIHHYLSNSSCEYYETLCDISKRKFTSPVKKLLKRFMPEYIIPNEFIYVDDADDIFDILEKIIFEKL